MKPAFAPHQIARENFQPIRDWVIATEMNFEGRTLSSGVILLGDNGRADGIRPRWGQVYAVGPEQTDIKVGDWICVAHGRWTRGLDIEDESGKRTVRRIDPNDILLVSADRPNDDTISNAVNA
jgi:hypothetical protein